MNIKKDVERLLSTGEAVKGARVDFRPGDRFFLLVMFTEKDLKIVGARREFEPKSWKAFFKGWGIDLHVHEMA